MEQLLKNLVMLIATLLPSYIAAYGNGMVSEACVSMMPSHGALAQTNAAPYTLNLSKNTYSAGDRITVYLGSTTSQYKGFLLEARTVNDNAIVGTFDISGSSGLQTLTCTNANSAVSHTSSSLKSNIQVIWVAPSNGNATLSFRATVVQQKTTFWTNVVSAQITYTASDPTALPAASTTLANSKNPTNSGIRLSTPSIFGFSCFLVFLIVIFPNGI